MTVREIRDRLTKILEQDPRLTDYELTTLDQEQKFHRITEIGVQAGNTAVWLRTKPESIVLTPPPAQDRPGLDDILSMFPQDGEEGCH